MMVYLLKFTELQDGLIKRRGIKWVNMDQRTYALMKLV